MKKWLKKLANYLRQKNKFILQDPINFEEKFALSLTKRNTLLLSIFLFLILGGVIYFIISYTSLKKFIPGYPKNASELYEADEQNSILLKDLENKNKNLALWVSNLQSILSNQDSIQLTDIQDTLSKDSNFDYKSIVFERIKEDSLLRDKVNNYSDETEYSIVKSILTDALHYKSPFDGKHKPSTENQVNQTIYSVKKKEKVTNSMEGIVISKSKKSIIVQHPNNLITVYKNLEIIHPKLGEKINLGKTIGEVKDSVFQFEIWYKGKSIPSEIYTDL